MKINTAWRWRFIFTIACIAILSPIVLSEYNGDDYANSTIYGSVVRGEFPSLASAAYAEAVNWFSRGRAFILSAYLCVYVHGVCNQIWYLYAYKIFLAGFSLINLLLFARVIRELTGSTQFSRWSAVCYLALLPLQFQYETAFWTYHGMMQTVMFFAFLSVIFLLSFLKESSPARKIIELTSMLLSNAVALTIYEPALIIGPVLWFVFILRRYKSNIKSIFLFTILIALPTVAFLGLSAWARAHAVGEYDGVAMSLDPLKMTKTFIIQLSSAIPGLYSLLSILIGKEHLSNFTIGGCLWASMSILIFSVLIKMTVPAATKQDAPFSSLSAERLSLWIIGIAFLLFPCFLMSISKRYQDDLVFSRGWLPTYMSTFGLAMITALSTYARTTRTVRIALILLSAAGALSMQLALGKPHTAGHLKRAALSSAIKDGLFDSTKVDTFYMTDVDASDIDVICRHDGASKLISALSGKRITVLPVSTKHEAPETSNKPAVRLTFRRNRDRDDYTAIFIDENR